jgi:hypothetical protein
LRRRRWRQIDERRLKRSLAQAPGLLGRVSMRAQELRDEVARLRARHEVQINLVSPRPERGALTKADQPSFRM